jgi:hypothetical protein
MIYLLSESHLSVHGVPQDIKYKKTNIVGFRYKIENINDVFACDPNDVKQINLKELKYFVKKVMFH